MNSNLLIKLPLLIFATIAFWRIYMVVVNRIRVGLTSFVKKIK